MRIIGDFHSGEDCQGKKSREIIDAFEFTAQKAAGEDGRFSKVAFHEYNVFEAKSQLGFLRR